MTAGEAPATSRARIAPLVAGAALLAAFELAHVWFIMPLPGSQRVRSLALAYALYRWRWAVRAVALVLIAVGLAPAWRAGGARRWAAAAALVVAAGATYAANVAMAADHMFRTPQRLDMRAAAENRVDGRRLVVGVVVNGDARAYPVQFLGYHHQVYDTVGGRPVLVTYCTVCRTGRAFSPAVGGRSETFRLVGMDQFNAMLEDHSTGSWWRQANGEAVAGPRVGSTLEELPSQQVTLARWLAMHPMSRVMQADPSARGEYPPDTSYAYESGTSRKTLTGTDTVSWRDKAWVVGVARGGAARAYDWNRLKRERVVNDTVGGVPVVLALASDTASFVAYRRPNAATRFTLRGDSLVAGAGVTPGVAYGFDGRGAAGALAPVNASQEFWHSWRSFHPGTTRY